MNTAPNTTAKSDPSKVRVDLLPMEVAELTFENEAMDLSKVDYNAPVILAMQKDGSAEDGTPKKFSSACHEEIRQLLKDGADPLLTTDTGLSALHKAAAAGDKELCEMLLEHGAKINIFDELGWTPLHRAAYYGHYDVCCYLISRGANVQASCHGRTALYHAVRERNYREAAVLLLLDCACLQEVMFIFKHDLGLCGFVATVLLACGYEIGRPYECTPLMGAARLGLHEICHELLLCGANPNLRDKRGWMALDFAKDQEAYPMQFTPEGLVDYAKTIALLETYADRA